VGRYGIRTMSPPSTESIVEDAVLRDMLLPNLYSEGVRIQGADKIVEVNS
jgi:hypothetical protein